MLKIIFPHKFITQFEELDEKIKDLAERKIDIFKENPKHHSLKTHKLNGRLVEFFSFSIDVKFRIVFEYGNKNTVHFLKIGNHDIYR